MSDKLYVVRDDFKLLVIVHTKIAADNFMRFFHGDAHIGLRIVGKEKTSYYRYDGIEEDLK